MFYFPNKLRQKSKNKEKKNLGKQLLWLLPRHRMLDNEARFNLVCCTHTADVKVCPQIYYLILIT